MASDLLKLHYSVQNAAFNTHVVQGSEQEPVAAISDLLWEKWLWTVDARETVTAKAPFFFFF
jgi:hypothetical protein